MKLPDNLRKRLINRDNLFVLMILVLSAILILLPTGFEERLPENAVRCKGLVTEVDNSGVQQFGIVKKASKA